MKRFLEPLTAMHEGEHVYRGRYGAKEDDRREYPKAEHPVIRTHPVSGRKALFVNRGFTTRIVQLKKTESAAVLELLWRHVETPELHCRFRWQPRSVAFWDNRGVQHHAMWDYFPQRRHGHRVTIRGDKPFYPSLTSERRDLMAAYAIGRLQMRDPSWVAEYGPKTAELVKKHGGRYLVRGGAMERLEGQGALPIVMVVLEFPSMAQAKAWHDDTGLRAADQAASGRIRPRLRPRRGRLRPFRVSQTEQSSGS
jgi:uncharacterized protein (DUF1330 family)